MFRQPPRSAFQTRKPPRAGRPAHKSANGYRQWLRKLPCAACETPSSERDPVRCAHVDHAGDKGVGTKVADRHSIPLCDECHTEQHRDGWRTFEAKRLHGGDAVALAAIYWSQWPGRVAWERALVASDETAR